MDWADLISGVAAALAEQPLLTRGEPGGLAFPPSLLVAVTSAEPVTLWGQRLPADGEPSADDSGESVRVFDGPRELLAGGIIGAAERAAGGGVDAVIAISALSTFRLPLMPDDAALAAVRRGLDRFRDPQWAEALDCLAARTGELTGLLAAARSSHHRSWPHITLGDQLLAEAVAAAVAGGAASASGIPPARWLFPFGVFCQLGITAAASAVGTIERWLGVEFRPTQGHGRLASLAEFIVGETGQLHDGCQCKNDTDPYEAAFTRRGPCRQIDHDIRRWQPGQPKPGSKTRFADTLWGWLRRWLGGAAGTAGANPGSQPRLQPNDVAGSLIARKWLCTQHGLGGPVLLYDRILPERCRTCGERPRVRSAHTEGGGTRINRVCCRQPDLVYQCEIIERAGKPRLKPKLGLVLSSAEGVSGYMTTEELGALWVCHVSGRYSRSGSYCPNPDCGSHPPGGHSSFTHGWVLVPLSGAWNDLETTAKQADAPVQVAPEHQISEADLRFLRTEIRRLRPADQLRLDTPEEIWAVAQTLSGDEVASFADLAGSRGAELILQCKEIATGGTERAETDRQPRTDDDEREAAR